MRALFLVPSALCVLAQDDEGLLDNAAAIAGDSIDLDALVAAAAPLSGPGSATYLPPLGQRMAIARDIAFSFSYPHLLQGWRAQGADLSFFSPLADEPRTQRWPSTRTSTRLDPR